MSQRGFSATELMVVLAIVGILAIIAVDLYSSNIQQGRRGDAVNSLLSMSLAEERYRAINTTYGTLAQVWGGVTASAQGYYTLAISGVSGTGYTLTATAVGTQASDTANGTTCSPLTLTASNGTVTQTPAVCWPQ